MNEARTVSRNKNKRDEVREDIIYIPTNRDRDLKNQNQLNRIIRGNYNT